MASIDANNKTSIFRYDQALVIAAGRQSAFIHPVRLKYQAGGYAAGTVLAKNTTDSLTQAYNDAGASGINTATCILLEAHPVEDFPGTTSTDTTLATALFGGCEVHYASLVGIDANGVADLGGKLITLLDSTVLMKF